MLLRTVGALGGPGVLEVVVADLTRRSDVLGAAAAIAARHGAVHLLVNNAGAHFPHHRLSADGVEMHVALDYLAGYGLTAALAGPLARGRSRVVNVASDTINDSRQLTLVGPARPATLDLGAVDDLRQLNPPDGFHAFEAYARAKLMTVTTDPALDGVTGRYYRRDTPSTTPPVAHDPTVQQQLVDLSDAHFAR